MKVRIVPLFLVLVFAACANRDAALSRTMAGLDAAQKVFIEQDAKRQGEIVDAAQSAEEGKATLLAYRAKRDRLAVAFVAAYSAVAVASLDLTDAAIGHVALLAANVIASLRELGMLPGERAL